MPKLSDNQIGDRLYAALEAIGTDEGETIRGNTALVAARQALSLLAQGLLIAAERNSDDVSVMMNQPIVPRPNSLRFTLHEKNQTKRSYCPACKGTGFQKVKQPRQPGRKIFPARCTNCFGKGRRVKPDRQLQ